MICSLKWKWMEITLLLCGNGWRSSRCLLASRSLCLIPSWFLFLLISLPHTLLASWSSCLILFLPLIWSSGRPPWFWNKMELHQIHSWPGRPSSRQTRAHDRPHSWGRGGGRETNQVEEVGVWAGGGEVIKRHLWACGWYEGTWTNHKPVSQWLDVLEPIGLGEIVLMEDAFSSDESSYIQWRTLQIFISGRRQILISQDGPRLKSLEIHKYQQMKSRILNINFPDLYGEDGLAASPWWVAPDPAAPQGNCDHPDHNDDYNHHRSYHDIIRTSPRSLRVLIRLRKERSRRGSKNWTNTPTLTTTWYTSWPRWRGRMTQPGH